MNRAWLLTVGLCVACAGNRAPGAPTRAEPEPIVATIMRRNQYRERERQQLGLGLIDIAVRPVDEPVINLDDVEVELRSTSDALLLHKRVRKGGTVQFDSVRAGTYAVIAKRLGYRSLRLPGVVIEAGCRLEIEAYLQVAPVDYYPENPPGRRVETAPRATITSCAKLY